MRNRGYTLIEVLLAIGIFAFLGTALIALMRQGVFLWHTAESRGRVYERARAILDTMGDDLRSMGTDVGDRGSRFWIRFLCDEDSLGRQRLRFVRTIAAETSDPIARNGGEFVAVGEGGYYDQNDDLVEIEEGRLLAPGGYQEVIYALHPDPAGNTLLRGVRSPIGGDGSLFIDANLELSLRDAAREGGRKRGKKGAEGARGFGRGSDKELGEKATTPVKERAATRLESVAHPLVGDVLFIGYRFWLPTTNTWNSDHPPRRRRGKAPSGPTDYWDSTRAILSEESRDSGTFAWKTIKDSLTNPHDDLFPERVEISLVLRGNIENRGIELTRPLSTGSDMIHVNRLPDLPEDGPMRYIMVGDEWIRYENFDQGRIMVARDGRGARGTSPAKHPAGMPLEIGTSFRRVVELPTFRLPVDWNSDRREGR